MTLPERIAAWCDRNSSPKCREVEFQAILEAMTGDGEYEPSRFALRVAATIMDEHNRERS